MCCWSVLPAPVALPVLVPIPPAPIMALQTWRQRAYNAVAPAAVEPRAPLPAVAVIPKVLMVPEIIVRPADDHVNAQTLIIRQIDPVGISVPVPVRRRMLRWAAVI